MLDLAEASANTSANLAESLADKPNPVRESATILAESAKSSPDAAARFITPSIPSNMALVSQPACAMYWNASADSVAENLVFAPISIALSLNFSNSPEVAPAIA